VGGACSAHGKPQKCVQTFWSSNLKGRDLSPSHRWEGNIKMYLIETVYNGVDCSHVAQDMVQWRVLVNTAINIWVPQKEGNFLSS
jgi:hypothetical protein